MLPEVKVVVYKDWWPIMGGSPVAWSSSRQAFATLSTTESELVSMCEALVLGNSVGSLVAEVQQHPVEELTRVMYADNLGAISLAKGGAAASWRTRHLRIRFHALRDAVTSGGWILLHLRGDELVADGMTKALVGQSQEKFITDLCMRIASGVEEQVEQDEKERIKLATAGAALIAGGAQCQGEAGDALTLAGATVLCVAAARERKPESNVPQMRVMMNRRDGAGGGRDERYHAWRCFGVAWLLFFCVLGVFGCCSCCCWWCWCWCWCCCWCWLLVGWLVGWLVGSWLVVGW